jgi:hypothetical protein
LWVVVGYGVVTFGNGMDCSDAAKPRLASGGGVVVIGEVTDETTQLLILSVPAG